MLGFGKPLVLLHWSFGILSRAIAAHSRVQIFHERFQAVETGALLSPRYYPPSPAQPLRKRQSACAANQHPCFELGVIGEGFCCSNDQYCIVDPRDSGKAACCQIGSTCGSKCAESQVECASTATITSAGTTSTSLVPACCGRRCPQTSMFGCPESFGNGCCPYGQTCAPDNKCIITKGESTTESAIVPLIPPGCTTSQISCASSLGGGCCAVTQSCVRLESGPGCAEVTITPTASGIAAVPTDDNELSAGAKAGISVGVIVVAGLVIGGATYMCLRRRRRSRSVAASSSANPRPGNVVGALIGGGGGVRDMTDLNSDSVSRPGGGLPGVAQDYFGPDPQIGPYSDAHHDQLSPGTTPGAAERGGVPVMPHGPGDIAVPVEIDSRAAQTSPGAGSMALTSPESGEMVNDVANSGNNGSRFQPLPSHVAVEGTFELYGSEPDPPRGSVTPYVPSPSGNDSQVSPSGETIPSPSPGIDGGTGRR